MLLHRSKGNAMSDLSQYVDPFIGVDGGGNVFPGPCVPFGMVKVGPDCGGKDWNAGWGSRWEYTWVQ